MTAVTAILKLHFNFIIMRTMACALHPAVDPGTADPSLAGPALRRLAPEAMTCCECAEVSFTEIAAHMAQDGTTLDEVVRKTGCGTTCTACLPDLRRFLSSL